jgi:N-acyl homoserine lactone hydrolase
VYFHVTIDMRPRPGKFKRGGGRLIWNDFSRVKAPGTSEMRAGLRRARRARPLPGALTKPLHPGNIPRPDANSVCCCGLWEDIMRRTLSMLAIGVCANALAGLSALAQAAPEVTLTRLDCGTSRPPTDVGVRTGSGLRFSDTYDFSGLKVQLVFSCYLIKHGGDYMVWDAGFGKGAGATAPKETIPELLAKLELKPENVKYIGISHFDGDHIGQVDLFPKSTLLIGKGDWEVLTDPAKKSPRANPATFAPWISGGAKVEPVAVDHDVFGDGTVVMLNTPGHTPGHHSLMVNLKEKGYVLLSGDLVHFQENYDTNGVPMFNTDRADTLSSLDRFKKIAANLKATVVIQHDARDVGKLPVFPAAAK